MYNFVLSLGDNTFTDVTKESGIGPARYGNGASWTDVDQDGDLDLYVTTVGDTRHYLYINYGGWFKEEASIRNCSLKFPSSRKLVGMSANFGDFDNDGYPDLYVTEWIPHSLGKVIRLGLSIKLSLIKFSLFGCFNPHVCAFRLTLSTRCCRN